MPLARFMLRRHRNLLGCDLLPRASGAASAGFTLVEALVALAIVSVVVLGGIKLFTVTADGLREAQRRSYALACADYETVRVRVSPLLQTPGSSEVGCRQGLDQFQVQINVSSTPHQNFRRLTIRVRQEGPLILAERVAFLPVGF